MKKIVQILLMFFVSSVSAQKFPKDVIAGKCYIKCFDYNAKIEWTEISCDSVRKARSNSSFLIKGEKAANIIKNRIKFKKYQVKLIQLGYDLEVNGCMDDKTVEAHHQYLKDKNKAAKKEAKRIKKFKRDSLKQIKLQNKRSQKAL